eukprot:TRINITY_DN532_c0_g1_i1.p1 TRINITY_DN532_c0_g1~~TRINITY_DN532_c0_g1_i1.p1  ORF type:complete len:1005 (-),score=313.39 TRINITY_DN532_c0_g1_i1:166-3180(-)
MKKGGYAPLNLKDDIPEIVVLSDLDFKKKETVQVLEPVKKVEITPPFSHYFNAKKEDYIRVFEQALALTYELEDLNTENLIQNLKTKFAGVLSQEDLAFSFQKMEALRGVEYQLKELTTLLSGQEHPFYPANSFSAAVLKGLNDDLRKEKEGKYKNLTNLYESFKRFDIDQLEGVAFVKINKARDLESKDINGKSDPFVRVYLLPEEEGARAKKKVDFETKVIKANLNPVWNEEFRVPVSRAVTALELYVYDWDNLSPPDRIGSVIFPMTQLKKGLQSGWFRVQKEKGDQKKRGELDLSIFFGQLASAQKEERPNYYFLYNLMFTLLVKSPEGFAPLTADENKLMESYASFYGLRPISQLLVQLAYSLSFMEDDYIDAAPFVTSLFSRIIQLLDKTKAPLSTQEQKCWNEMMDVFYEHSEHYLLHYKLKFSESPSAIGLFLKVLDVIKDHCPKMKGCATKDFANKILKSQVEEQYAWVEDNGLGICNSKKHTEDCCRSAQLSYMCSEIVKALKEDKVTYAKFFAVLSQDEVLLKNGQENAKIFARDVNKFFATAQKKNFNEGLQLYFRILDLFEFYNTQLKIDIEQNFTITDSVFEFYVAWTKDITFKAHAWIDSALGAEKWQKTSDSAFHSSSVVDYFSMLHQSVGILKRMKWKQREGKAAPFDLLDKYCKVVNETTEYYVTSLRKYYPKEGTPATPTTPTAGGAAAAAAKKEKETKFVITNQHCALLSNLHAVEYYLQEFVRQVGKIGEPSSSWDEYQRNLMAGVSALLKQEIQTLLEGINKGFSKSVRAYFWEMLQLTADANLAKSKSTTFTNLFNKLSESLFEDDDDDDDGAKKKEQQVKKTSEQDKVQPLFDYFDAQLTLVSENTIPVFFSRVLDQIWSSTIRILEEIALPAKPELKLVPEQTALTQKLVEPLQTYFIAGGKGQDETLVKSSTSRLKMILESYDLPTRELADMYRAKANKDEVCAGQLLKLISLRAKDDKEAAKFVAENTKKDPPKTPK